MAGTGLSLATVRPQIALFLATPFLFRHRRVFWGFVVGSSILAAVSLGLLKIDGALQFLESLRYIESTIWKEAHGFDMPTMAGIIRRNCEVADPAPIKALIWACYVLGAAAFCALWHESDEIEERHIGSIVMASVFPLLPYAHYHELTLLLIPTLCVVRLLERTDVVRQDHLAIGPLLVSWFTALGFVGSGFLKFPFVYVTMLVLGCMLLQSGRRMTAGNASWRRLPDRWRRD